jgi:hypothetical protein
MKLFLLLLYKNHCVPLPPPTLMKQLLYISFLQLIYIFYAGIFTGPIMLLVGFGYYICNIMYEYLLKQMSPDQGNICLNCHNNKE